MWNSESESDSESGVLYYRVYSVSKVKTITYPGAETDSVTSGEFLPVPEKTFVCNNLLSENLENFIDDAKVKFSLRLQAYITYYLRQNSKTGEAKQESGLLCKLKNDSQHQDCHVKVISKRKAVIKTIKNKVNKYKNTKWALFIDSKWLWLTVCG